MMRAHRRAPRRGDADPLQAIPGIGPSIAADLRTIGIARVADLRGRDPQRLYAASNRRAGVTQDRCLLYAFRCAVYYANTARPDPERLKWWNWSDANLAGRGPRRRARR